MKRDSSVELLRIFACWIVVGTHIKLSGYYNADGSVDKSRTILSNFFGEGVGIFFIILGFFYFRNKDFLKVCIRTVKTVILPALFFIIVVDILEGWINNTKSILDCIRGFDIEVKSIMNGLLSWDSTKFFAGQHLWFCFTYIQCILWFPILKILYENKKSVLRYILILGILALIIVDVQKTYKFIDGNIASFSVVPIPVLLLLLGNELYAHKEFFVNKKYFFVIGVLIYFTFHIILFYVQCDALNNSTGYGFAWNSIYSVITACGIAMAFLAVEIKSNAVSKAINYVGGKTFLIYLVHYPLIMKMNENGVREFFLKKCSINKGWMADLIYTISYSLFVFCVSLVMAVIIDSIYYISKSMINKAKKLNNASQ